MEARPAQSHTTPNAPSVERAYKIKCVDLTKRLQEVLDQVEHTRTRNKRGWQAIKRLRLQTSFFLHQLAKLTAMLDEADTNNPDPELQARAAALLSNSAPLANLSASLGGNSGYIDDDTEGSSDEQPPTPEERPLRVKRSRKSNMPAEGEEDGQAQEEAGEAADEGSSALPRLAPAPSQQDLTSSFRVQGGSNGSAHDGEQTPHSQDTREGAQPAEAGPDSGTTPMDMDPVEPKAEE